MSEDAQTAELGGIFKDWDRIYTNMICGNISLSPDTPPHTHTRTRVRMLVKELSARLSRPVECSQTRYWHCPACR